MFTKQNTKQKFTNTLCLQKQNWSVSTTYVYKTSYVYKTKYKTESLQNKTKVYIQLMFIKQVMYRKQSKSYETEGLQNKTKVYIQVMFTKQNTKQKVYKTKLKFTYKLCL